jgi:cytochrome P450
VFDTHSAVRQALDDVDAFTAVGVINCGQSAPLLPLQTPPAEHPRIRRALDTALTTHRVAALEPRLRQRARSLVSPLAERGGGDVASTVARWLPVHALVELLDLPADDAGHLRDLHDRVLGPGAADRAGVKRAGREIESYFSGVVEERRGQSGPGLVRALSTPDDRDLALSDNEVASVCYLLLLAGIDPVAAAIGAAAAHLALEPRHQAVIHSPRELRRYVEELLRWSAPVVALPRRCVAGTDVAGLTVVTGAPVECRVAAANRDPAVFDSPDAFRPGRRERHLAFGSGPHHCAGAHLARLQIGLAIEELIRALPGFGPDPAHPAPDPTQLAAGDPVVIVTGD